MSKKKKSAQSSSTQSTNQSSQPTRSRAANFAGKRYPTSTPQCGSSVTSPPKVGNVKPVAKAPKVRKPRDPNSPRLLREEVARKLGFEEYQIPILTRVGVLTPLGNPSRSTVKLYARDVIDEYAKDPKWLNDATAAIYNYWRKVKGRI